MIVFDLFKQTFKICIRLKLPTAITVSLSMLLITYHYLVMKSAYHS